jgi:hypothetical protein
MFENQPMLGICKLLDWNSQICAYDDTIASTLQQLLDQWIIYSSILSILLKMFEI